VFSVSGIGEARARDAKEQKAISDENSIFGVFCRGIEVRVVVIERMDKVTSASFN
jgi:hypothetical protein